MDRPRPPLARRTIDPRSAALPRSFLQRAGGTDPVAGGCLDRPGGAARRGVARAIFPAFR